MLGWSQAARWARAGILASLAGGLVPAAEEPPRPFPDLATHVGRIVGSDYYDADRIHPRVMVERALWSLEAAEISLDTDWVDGVINLRIGEASTSIEAAEPADVLSAMRLLDEIRQALSVSSDLDAQRRRELAYALVNGALQSLDPHTLVLPPEPADEFAEEISGEFFGIGAYLSQEDGIIRIDRVMDGLPAQRGGVEDGDIVLAVDGERTVGLSLAQAVARIKGPKGTQVLLTVERTGEAGPEVHELSIIRDRIQMVTMRSYRDGAVGYVRMDEFNRKTASDLYTELLRLRAAEQGPMRGFVLDLRYNSGGLLAQAKAIADFFIGGRHEIVRTVSLGRRDRVSYSSAKTLLDLPMVVITGPASASAAEIVAGALQLNDRAVVAGRTTFGKGSVQTIVGLPDTSHLKITIQEYRLRDGLSIQQVGVIPDLELLPRSVADDGLVDLAPYSFRREADDEFALASANAYANAISYRLGWLREHRDEDALRMHALSSTDFRPDQEAQLVIDLLRETVVNDASYRALGAALAADTMRTTLLTELTQVVQARSEVETAELAAALAASPSPADWGPDAEIAPEQIAISYLGPETLPAGESVSLRFSLRNTGSTDVGRIWGLIDADLESPLWESELVAGMIPAGETREITVPFDVPPRSFAGDERFELILKHADEMEPVASLPVTVAVAAAPRPLLGLSWAVTDDPQLALDSDRTFQLSVTNHGEAPTAPLTMLVFKDNDAFVQLGEGRFRLEPLAPGETRDVTVPLRIRSSYEVAGRERVFDAEGVVLQVRVAESFDDQDNRYGVGLFRRIELPLTEPVEPGSVLQPRVSMATSVADGVLALELSVEDDNPAYVAVFHGEEKVALFNAGAAEDEPMSVFLPLDEGLNEIRVVANDATDISGFATTRIWHTSSEEVLSDAD